VEARVLSGSNWNLACESDVAYVWFEECSDNLRGGTVCVSNSLVGKALTRESRRRWAASA
jgi:hypothetical protein